MVRVHKCGNSDEGVDPIEQITDRGEMGDRRRIDRVAARQYGVFSTQQAREAGFDKRAVGRRVGSGEWIRLDHSVLALASSPPKWERQLAAAILSRPQAIVTGTTAAHLHGLRGFRRARPVILVPTGANTRSAVARIIESDLFEQIGTQRELGFEVTTVAETLLIIARDLPEWRLGEAFDDALLTGKLKLASFDRILAREEGRRTGGIRLIRKMVACRSPSAPTPSSTYLEAVLERVLGRSEAIPPWTREHPILLRGRPARVDVYIPDWALVAEADGRSWHMRHSDFDTDRRRDNALAAQGIQVLRFTYRMLQEDPDQCLADLVAAGSVRAAQGPG
jgi:hypothetical protein